MEIMIYPSASVARFIREQTELLSRRILGLRRCIINIFCVCFYHSLSNSDEDGMKWKC